MMSTIFYFVSHLVKAAAYLLSLLSTICIIIPLAEGSMSLTVSLQQEIIARFSELESANAFCLVVFFFSSRGLPGSDVPRYELVGYGNDVTFV